MSLYTTYGVQSSVPAKTVVAVITPQIEASSINYSISYFNGSWYDTPQIGSTTPVIGSYRSESWSSTFHRTNWTSLEANFIKVTNMQTGTEIKFHNGTNYLGDYSNRAPYTQRLAELVNDTFIEVPNGATHFILQTTLLNNFNAFQTMTVSYGNPIPYTIVTFFDEYPNGTQIGDVVEVGSSTENYSIQFFQNSHYQPNSNNIATTANIHRTNKIIIINDSLNISNFQYISWINFYDINDNPLTHYGTDNGVPVGSGSIASNITNGVFNLPNNAYSFALIADGRSSSGWTPKNISYSNFQTITASYSTGASGIVNPPATYKIRQLVFEE